eukprot:8332344-Pyramimonas_sp.AAC.1
MHPPPNRPVVNRGAAGRAARRPRPLAGSHGSAATALGRRRRRFLSAIPRMRGRAGASCAQRAAPNSTL